MNKEQNGDQTTLAPGMETQHGNCPNDKENRDGLELDCTEEQSPALLLGKQAVAKAQEKGLTHTDTNENIGITETKVSKLCGAPTAAADSNINDELTEVHTHEGYIKTSKNFQVNISSNAAVSATKDTQHSMDSHQMYYTRSKTFQEFHGTKDHVTDNGNYSLMKTQDHSNKNTTEDLKGQENIEKAAGYKNVFNLTGSQFLKEYSTTAATTYETLQPADTDNFNAPTTDSTTKLQKKPKHNYNLQTYSSSNATVSATNDNQHSMDSHEGHDEFHAIKVNMTDKIMDNQSSGVNETNVSTKMQNNHKKSTFEETKGQETAETVDRCKWHFNSEKGIPVKSLTETAKSMNRIQQTEAKDEFTMDNLCNNQTTDSTLESQEKTTCTSEESANIHKNHTTEKTKRLDTGEHTVQQFTEQGDSHLVEIAASGTSQNLGSNSDQPFPNEQKHQSIPQNGNAVAGGLDQTLNNLKPEISNKSRTTINVQNAEICGNYKNKKLQNRKTTEESKHSADVTPEMAQDDDRAEKCFLCGNHILHNVKTCKKCCDKNFCDQCFKIYHQHPNRRKHQKATENKHSEHESRWQIGGSKEMGHQEESTSNSSWTCNQCTFLNKNLKELCEICGGKRITDDHFKLKSYNKMQNTATGYQEKNDSQDEFFIDQIQEDDDEEMTAEKQKQEDTLTWTCEHCTYKNSMNDYICRVCSKTTEALRQFPAQVNNDDDDYHDDEDPYKSLESVHAYVTTYNDVQEQHRKSGDENIRKSTGKRDTKSRKSSSVCVYCSRKHYGSDRIYEECKRKTLVDVIRRRLMGEELLQDSQKAKIAAELILTTGCSQEEAVEVSKKSNNIQEAVTELGKKNSSGKHFLKWLWQ